MSLTKYHFSSVGKGTADGVTVDLRYTIGDKASLQITIDGLTVVLANITLQR